MCNTVLAICGLSLRYSIETDTEHFEPVSTCQVFWYLMVTLTYEPLGSVTQETAIIRIISVSPLLSGLGLLQLTLQSVPLVRPKSSLENADPFISAKIQMQEDTQVRY